MSYSGLCVFGIAGSTHYYCHCQMKLLDTASIRNNIMADAGNKNSDEAAGGC